MVGLAIWAMTAISAICDHGEGTAIGAETMPLVPVEERTRLREQRQLGSGQEALGRNASEIDAVGERLSRFRSEDGASLCIEPEEDRGLRIHHWLMGDTAAVKHHLVAIEPDQFRAAIGIRGPVPVTWMLASWKARSCADWKRSRGSFSRQRCTTASTSGWGRDGGSS